MVTLSRAIGAPAPGARARYIESVLLVVMVIKESMFRYVLRESISVESSAVQTDAWHHRKDAINSLAASLASLLRWWAARDTNSPMILRQWPLHCDG